MTVANNLLGVPFYPSGSSPKAECPICSVDEPKDLFPLYSSRIGELDPRIPRKYFEKADLAVLNEAVPGCDVIKVCVIFSAFSPVTKQEEGWLLTVNALVPI